MSNISNEFKEAVKKWVDLDNERKNVMQKSNNIKKDMDNIESFIITFMESNNMTDKTILINDGNNEVSGNWIQEKMVYFSSIQNKLHN